MEKSNQNTEFLQSEQWRKFQEAVGRKTFFIEVPSPPAPLPEGEGGFGASIIEHNLPIVGKYLYCPRGPVFLCHSERIHQQVEESKNPELNIISGNTKGSFTKFRMTGLKELIDLAKKQNAGWIRIEPKNEEILELIKKNISEILPRRTEYRIVKAPHDMQPKENFVLDISKSPEQLLTEMKPKTRYNIGVAQKHGVSIRIISNDEKNANEYIDAFLKLTKEMAVRQGITAHTEQYYRKMIEILPSEMLKIYVAEYAGKIIAANLILFYGDTATYLHGASGNIYRNLMAPFSLQWKAILDAKEQGYTKYDFGGVKVQDTRHKTQDTNSWEGITNFKLGFSPHTKPVEFPGSYDIVINPRKYAVYRGLQRAKSLLHKMRK